MSRAGLSIVVSGTIASVPGHGGWTWAILQYLLGLRRLGHRVQFIDALAAGSLQPSGAPLEASVNLAYFRTVMERFGLARASALLSADGSRRSIGLSYSTIEARVRGADLLINVSGALRDEGLLGGARRRVYLDLDPAFTQLWQTVEGLDMGLEGHTDFVTVGPAIGRSDCPVPTCGRQWIGIVPPIVLERWPAVSARPIDALTTIANWRGYGPIVHAGVRYGQKAHAWRELMALPTRTAQRFRPALAIHPGETADRQALAANRWEVVDPARVAGTPWRYQRFIQRSKAEIGIAKAGYVTSRCGWFSDRSVCYLASGRPVLAQDTGFTPFVPSGRGVIAFGTLDEALDGLERIRLDYATHARAARRLAESCFDSGVVLGRLLRRLEVVP